MAISEGETTRSIVVDTRKVDPTIDNTRSTVAKACIVDAVVILININPRFRRAYEIAVVSEGAKWITTRVRVIAN